MTTVAADASDEAAMSALFDRFGTNLPPLGGIYVAAFGGGPVRRCDMTDDDVTAMFAPKLNVVSLLHRLSLVQPVSQFVCFRRSLDCSARDGWATTRRRLPSLTRSPMRASGRLPATAVDWGLWKSLADNQRRTATCHPRIRARADADEVAIHALRAITCRDTPAAAR